MCNKWKDDNETKKNYPSKDFSSLKTLFIFEKGFI